MPTRFCAMNLRSRIKCKEDIDKGHIIGNFSLVSLRCVTQLVVQFLLGMCTTHYNLLIPEPAKLQVGTNVSEADKS